MGNYRNVSVSFWTDSKIDDDFTPEDKYFYLYLLTNPHSSVCGCYEISIKQMARETGCEIETVRRIVDRMENVHRVIRYSPETKEILLLNWHKYNWTRSEKMKKAVLAVLPHIKNEEFKAYLTKRTEEKFGAKSGGKKNSPGKDKDTDKDTDKENDKENDKDVSIPYAYGIDTSDKRVCPPTLDEIAGYVREKGYTFSAERFFNWYQAKGWKQHGDDITDWRAAADNWAVSERGKKPQRKSGINPSDLESLSMFND